MSYPPTPSKKSCNCEDACISTDDVYYAGPNLPNSGINTYNILTSVIEKLDAIYAVPTLQRVTETGNVTTLPIIADSFVKIGGNGTNVLLDNGTTISLSSIGGSQNLQEVTDIGAITTNPITANAFIKSGGDGNNLLLDDGTVLPISDLPVGVTKTSELINDGQDGIHPFITAEDIPAFVPSDYDLDEFTNNNVDPFAKISDLPVYSDFIQDSITNGVIDKAPTENAVYDALQLKQDSLGYTPVNKAGDTMLGDLILNQDPSTALQAATKQYVDNIVSGINFHTPVTVATTGSLVATYNNGIDGVGATLTGPSVGVLMIDGETPTYLQRILVWQQADPIQNGIYDLTTVGDSVTVYQLTRSSDADNSPPGEIHYGDYTLTLSGDTNGGFGFICNTPGTIDIGTTPINYVQFNAAQAVTAGYGLQELTPNVIEIDALVTQEKITLTTTGTTGAATFITNTLNIPTLPQATASVSGYLSSTDWTTFNNKANVNSQVFTGTPSLPTGTIGVTQVAGTNNTTLATTEFATTVVNNRIATYKTYFVNTATGNNATGVYQDATKPFATIDYILANFTITDNDIFYLQGTGQTYAINSQLQAVKQSFITADGSTNILDFSGNTNTYAMVAGGSNNIVTINMPSGTIRNERSGGTGVIFSGYSGMLTSLNVNVKEIYWNTSTQMAQIGGLVCKIYSDKISSKIGPLFQLITNDIVVQEFVCLAAGASLCQYGKNIKLNLISGSGSYNFLNTNETTNVPKYIIGDVSATSGLLWTGYFGAIDVTFNNSIITTFALGTTSALKTIRGNIKSITTISGNINSTRFINFTANLGTGTFNIPASISQSPNIIFENCSIKSTNSPITIVNSGTPNASIEIKSSAFEVVNAVPLVTGGAGGTNTLKIAGLSSNVTTLSDQNGTGVTVSVIGKQVVADGVDSKDAVNKGQVDNRLVVETTTGYTLTNADSGGIVIFKTTASQTLTIPTGLADGFECTFVTLSGVTLTVVSTGNTLNNNTGTVMLPQLSFTLKRMLATNTYITAGSL